MRAAFTRSLISLALLSSQAVWATPFQPYIAIDNAQNPLSITSADFDSDGNADLAVTSYNTSPAANQVLVFLGAGDATFATAVPYTTGTTPSSITSADFNGGGVDLAVANSDADTISVFINSGTGTFAAKADTATGTKPVYILAAELNGANIDLVTANSTGNNISVLLNSGTGTFPTHTEYTTGTNPSAIAAGDFDSANQADLAVTNQDSDTVSVFINNGAGVFAAKVDYATGTAPTAIASQDINGDTYPDLVISNSGSNTISVLINKGASGPGTFYDKVDYTTGTTPTSVIISDLNNDTFKDIAVSNSASDSISVFTNNGGSGNMGIKADYSMRLQPGGLTVADIDADTHPDLIATGLASHNFSYLKNLTAVTPNSFSFTTQTGVALSTKITSNEITLSGLLSNTTLSIIGKEISNTDGTTTYSAEYSIDGGSTYTSSPSTVSNGTMIRVRLLSSSLSNTTETATITIGGFSTTFSVTTVPANTTPADINFTSVVNAEPGATVTSEAITWTSAAASIAIIGGEYSINGAAFTSTSGTINTNDTLKVRLTSSTTYGAPKEALLSFNSGGQTTTFVVFTKDNPSAGGSGGSSSLSIWFGLLMLGALLLRYRKALSNNSASLEPQSRIKYR